MPCLAVMTWLALRAMDPETQHYIFKSGNQFISIQWVFSFLVDPSMLSQNLRAVRKQEVQIITMHW
jgi:hypothetical protein